MKTPTEYKNAVYRVAAFKDLLATLEKERDNYTVGRNLDTYEDILDTIESTEQSIEELESFIKVGYPACLTTNSSMIN